MSLSCRLLPFLVMLAGPALADGPAAPRTNTREACRQELAGGYLRIYDDLSRAKTYGKTLESALAATVKAVKEAEKDAEGKRTAQKAAGYDLGRAVARDQAEARLDGLRQQEDSYRKLIAEATASLRQYEAQEKALRDSMTGVLVLERTGDKPDGGYPLRIRFRAECPKYRSLCPLPPEDADRLLKIEVDGQVPEACRRYAGIGRVQGKQAP